MGKAERRNACLAGLVQGGVIRAGLLVALGLVIAGCGGSAGTTSTQPESGVAASSERGDGGLDKQTAESGSPGESPEVEAGEYGPSAPSDSVPPRPPVSPGPSDPPGESPTSGSFSALTYNVAGLPDSLSGSNPEINTALIGPRLNEFDLVLVQESWLTPIPNPNAPLRTYHEELLATSTLPFQSESLPSPLGSDPTRPEALLSDGLNRFSNLAFAPPIRRRWTNCGPASADCLSLKGFSMARTTLAPGIEIDVYNLHMDAGSADFAIRAENVDELATFIEENSSGNAVIVGGDFNLHIDEEPDGSQFADLLARGELTDVCTELACDEPTRIDKFLYRSIPGLTLAPTTWSNLTSDFLRSDGLRLSDHDPVLANFDWSTE